MSKLPVAFLENGKSGPNFLSEKYVSILAKDTEYVPVAIIISKLHSNKVMLPVRFLFPADR